MAVPQGDAVVPLINSLIPGFDIVVATKDWHPRNHVSFASSHPGKKVLDEIEGAHGNQVLWPEHCVQSSQGARFHPDLDLDGLNLILHKGMKRGIDSYSAFYENDRKTETGLRYYLQGLKVDEVYIGGLALDYCVYYSALDAVRCGFKTSVVMDACRGVNFPESSVDSALDSMRGEGVILLNSKEVI